MSKSKRTLSGGLDSSIAKMRKHNGEFRRPHLETVLNESVNSDFDLNSSASRNANKRISLSRQEGTRKSLLPTFSKTVEDSDKPDQIDIVQPLNPEEYRSNLSSLAEIMSKRFDPKKAFSYNFINIINNFINNDKGHVDFKLIAGALEAGTKVYTSKVDVVYRNTQKVSSSLSMATDEKEQFDEDDALFDELNDRYEKKNRKAKRAKKNANLIVTNVESINGKFETNIEIDPLFYHLSAAFDVGNVNSLLMANLTTNPHGAMLLDSNAMLNFNPSENIDNTLMSVSIFKDDLKDPFGERCISAQFIDFEFSRRDINIEVAPREEESTNLNYDFNINAEVDDVNEMFDNEIDFGDNFQSDTEHADDNGTSKENELEPPINFETENLLRILPDNDNQFFNINFLKSIFKKMSRFEKAKINLNTSESKKPKQRKERAVHQENKYCLQFTGYKANDNQKYSQTTLEKWITNSSTFALKNDYGFHSSSLRESFLKKNTHFHELFKSARKAPQEVKESDPLFEEGLDNDFSDDGRHDGDDFSTNFHPEDEPPRSLDQQTDYKIDDEPMHIDALDIDYAKVAKKIDIKRVKKGMWDIIVKESTDTHSMFSTQTLSTQESTTSSQCKTLTFCNLKQNLPNYINANLNENLSVPISFVALLHLCNEKSLSLTSQDKLSDFFIQAQFPI